MPAWRDRMQPGSWRGIPFVTDSTASTFGRRVVVTDMPARDKPEVQDLGRATRIMRLDAYWASADYMDVRDAMINAVERRGSGVLVHPYLGRMTVTLAEPADFSETTQDGGMVRWSLSFVEAGERVFPNPVIATGPKVATAAEAVEVSTLDRFAAAFDAASDAAYVATDAVDRAVEIAGRVRDAANAPRALLLRTSAALNAAVTVIDAAAASIVSAPDAFAEALRDVFRASVATGEATHAVDFLSALIGSSEFEPADPSLPDGEAQVSANNAAMELMLLQLGLAEMAAGMAEMDFLSADAAEAARDSIAEEISSVAEQSDATSFGTLTELRNAIAADIDARALDLPRLRTVTPDAPTSTLLLAQLYYGDATRATQIATLNRIPCPALVGPDLLRILSA